MKKSRKQEAGAGGRKEKPSSLVLPPAPASCLLSFHSEIRIPQFYLNPLVRLDPTILTRVVWGGPS